MTPDALVTLSLEQVAAAFGDPTEAVFSRMYERFPALDHFRTEDGEWEHYMMQEILTNIMQYAEDPHSALVTIRDMTDHHQLIGVPMDVFRGLYSILLDVLGPAFEGEHRAAMLALWQQVIDDVERTVDRQISS